MKYLSWFFFSLMTKKQMCLLCLVRPRLPTREPVIKEMGADSVRLQWPRAEVPYYTRDQPTITYSVEMQEVRSHKHFNKHENACIYEFCIRTKTYMQIQNNTQWP